MQSTDSFQSLGSMKSLLLQLNQLRAVIGTYGQKKPRQSGGSWSISMYLTAINAQQL